MDHTPLPLVVDANPGDTGNRLCVDCEQVKPLDSFTRNRFRRDGFQPFCVPCGTIRVRKHRGVDPEVAHRVAPDGARCEICETDGGNKPLVLDHDHSDGSFRGWLCHRCNVAIGSFEDDLSLLRSAIRYLEASHFIH